MTAEQLISQLQQGTRHPMLVQAPGWFKEAVRSCLAGSRCAKLTLFFCVMFGFVTSALAQSNGQPNLENPAAQNLAFEVRMVWGGANSRSFAGEVSIDSGSIKLIRNLSLQPDSVGSIDASSASHLQVRAHSPSSFGGIDLAVQGKESSELTVAFKDPATGQLVRHSLPLSELLHDRWLEKLDEQGSRIAAERQPGDILRVVPGQSDIVDVGETWKATASGYRTGLSAGEYVLVAKVVDQQGNPLGEVSERSVTLDAKGDMPATKIEFTAPSLEGSFTVEFSLSPKKRFYNALVSTNPALSRRIDFVTFDQSRGPAMIGQWKPIASILPLQTQWWNPLAWLAPLSAPQTWTQNLSPQNWANLDNYNRAPISHGEHGSRVHDGKSYFLLQPGAWQSYPIQVAELGQPHRIRVRVPADQVQELIVSVRDNTPDGSPTSLNLDSGIKVDTHEIQPNGTLEHEILFWPRSLRPTLLLLNASPHRSAAFGEIQLEVGAPEFSSGPAKHDSKPAESGPSRRVGLYLTKPLLADAFGAARVPDPVNQRNLESWSTCQEAVQHLMQYIHQVKFNAVVLNVVADGAALFPSTKLLPTARYDTGIYFSDSRQTEIKDWLELLMLHMDRADAKLILSMSIDGPLPGLNRFDSPNNPSAIHQINIEGLRKDELNSQTWRWKHYNPLCPQVQSELEQVVREVVNRYGRHPSFGGIALELTPSSHFIFAGDRWGYDQSNLEKFEAATGAKLPTRVSASNPSSIERSTQAMQGVVQLSYLNWRASELAKFYSQLAGVVSQANPSSKLYLNPLSLRQAIPEEDNFLNPATVARDSKLLLLGYGIDPDLLAKSDVTLLQGQIERPLRTEIGSTSLKQEWQQATEEASTNQVQQPNVAAAILQQPLGFSIPEAQLLLGQSAQNSSSLRSPTTSWCYPNVSSIGIAARRSLIEQLYRGDCTLLTYGGWTPVQGALTDLSVLNQTLQELPEVTMSNLPIDNGNTNVRARQTRLGDSTYFQFINAASWTEVVTLDMVTSAGADAVHVLGGRQLMLEGQPVGFVNSSSDSKVWQFEIPPYDLVAIRVDDPQFRLNSLIHAPTGSIVDELARKLDAMELRIAQATDPGNTPHLGLTGGDFEQWTDDNRPVGWTVSSLPQVAISREAALPHSGRSCLQMENRNLAQVSAWIQSESIRIPPSGRLQVDAWVRTSPANQQPIKLRLSVIGRTHQNQKFHRWIDVGGASAPIASDWGRQPIRLYLPDLPSDDLAELHVAVDLVGPGKVWLDDIQVVEQYLSPEERMQIRGQLFFAKEKLREFNAFPAEQLLKSRWARYLELLTTQNNPSEKLTIDQPINPTNRWPTPGPILQQWREAMRQRWQR